MRIIEIVSVIINKITAHNLTFLLIGTSTNSDLSASSLHDITILYHGLSSESIPYKYKSAGLPKESFVGLLCRSSGFMPSFFNIICH